MPERLPPAPTELQSRTDGRWRALGILTVLYGVGTFGLLGVSPLAPSIREALSVPRGQIGLLVPALYVGGLVFCVPAGRIADRLAPSVTLTGGLALGGFALLLAASARNFAELLGCLLLAGVGWSIVNPALSRVILFLFVTKERGFAMGVKQMGQTVGGIVAALFLPIVAVSWGWRAGFGTSGCCVILLVILAWRPLRGIVCRPSTHRAQHAAMRTSWWWWLRRPAVLLFLATGVGLGMGQSALLSYLPLFATESLGTSTVGAGGLLALAQTGGALGRVGLGAASDRWLHGRRPPALLASSLLTATSFMLLASPLLTSSALALCAVFLAGLGALGWVGIYMVLAAELGGSRHAGLMSGVSMAFLLIGILIGGPTFGRVLDLTDSYGIAWSSFAVLSGIVGIALLAGGSAIHRACEANDEPAAESTIAPPGAGSRR